VKITCTFVGQLTISGTLSKLCTGFRRRREKKDRQLFLNFSRYDWTRKIWGEKRDEVIEEKGKKDED